MSKCWDCFYFGKNTITCDFYLITGARRGCPVGDACTRFTPRGDLRKQTVLVVKGSRPGRPRDDLRYQVVNSLYKQGLDDYRIAELTGFSRGTILNWRKREGLPANARGRREGRD